MEVISNYRLKILLTLLNVACDTHAGKNNFTFSYSQVNQTSSNSLLTVSCFPDPMSPKIMSSYGHEEALQNFNRLNITIGKDVSILQGSPLTIKCPVVGVPEPKIKWIKDRQMLSSNDRMDMDSCTGILNIFKMELEDSGDYACAAENFLGMHISFSAITVFGKILLML